MKKFKHSASIANVNPQNGTVNAIRKIGEFESFVTASNAAAIEKLDSQASIITVATSLFSNGSIIETTDVIEF
jgi:hypothetical protein